MNDTGPEITAADIRDLESKLDARLPAAYRRFLSRYNGGIPDPHHFRDEALSRFYSVRAREKSNDLMANHRRMRRWLPAGVMPIADDAFGNEICLAIQGKNRGKVYFWDHEGGIERIDPRIQFPWLDLSDLPDDYEFKGDDWPGHPDLTLIADSFDEFLDSFHDIDEPALEKAAPAKKARAVRRDEAAGDRRKPRAAKQPEQTPRNRRSR